MDKLSHTVIKMTLLSRNGAVLCPTASLIHSRLSTVVGRSGWQLGRAHKE